MSDKKARPHSRDIRNIFVNPRQQFKYAFIFFGGGLFMLALYVCTFLFVLNRSLGSLAASYGVDADIANSLRNSVNTAASATILFAIVIAGVMFSIGVALSHRIFGPMIPTFRVLQELKKGNYSARIHYRKHDEFQDVMNAINELATELERGTEVPLKLKIPKACDRA